jgi:PAS domain S-box-containing protein
MMLTAIWLVVDAKDGFRSLSMLTFPGLLLLSVVLLDRASYLTVAGIVLLAVTSLGMAERHGLTRAVPGRRSRTTYESIFYVDLVLLVYAAIGSRIARDAQKNVSDLRRSISQFSTANIDLKATAEALRENEQRLFSIYNTVHDVIFHLAVEPEGKFRFVSVNAAFLKATGLNREAVVGKTVNEVIPEPSLTIVLGKYREAVEEKAIVSWEETSHYPTGQLTGEVSVSPVFDDKGICTHLVGSVHDITERTQAEAALRESEERFRFAQKAAGIGTFDWNIETGASAWTPELEVMYGLPPGGFPGTQEAWVNLVHGDDRVRVLQRLRESLETGAPAEEEWRVIWPDHSLHWIVGRWQVVKNATGEPLHVVGINIDVTNRKHMEEALRKSEERFRLASKATNDAIWDIDLKAETVSWNDMYSVVYGRPESANSLQFWIDRIHPKDRAQTVGDFQAALGRGAASWSAEYRFRRVDGEWAYIHDRAYIARDQSGKAWRVIGAMQDLTEQKKAEAALRESEERFRRVFEEGPLGMALQSPDHRFLKVNNAFCQMVGYSAAELVAQMSFVDLTHPDDVQTDLELSDRLFRPEIPSYRMQKRYVTKDGAILWVNLTKSMIVDNDGAPLYGITMVEDITESKRAQEEGFARQKLESVGTLASGIVHDFNNLLGSVLAQAEVAIAELAANSTPEMELRLIRDVAIKGGEIVRELMIYSGTESEVLEPLDVSRIVIGMLDLLRVSISKHAALETDLRQNLPAVRANASQIRRIVMNLVTNASEAMGERDGVIRVSTSCVTVGQAEATSKGVPVGDYLQFEVSDMGKGMSPEIKARMFDPFFTTKSAGRGLGMAVVHGIVRNIQGAIELISEPGMGTTCRILLPVIQLSPGQPAGVPTNKEVSQASQVATILVVEDEDPLRQAVTKFLGKNGFEVLEAATGFAAIDLLRASGTKIDVVLLDLTLPGASSDAIVSEAAQLRPEVKVILTSAYNEEKAREVMRGLEVRDFIRKPFRLNDLVRTIQTVLAA